MERGSRRGELWGSTCVAGRACLVLAATSWARQQDAVVLRPGTTNHRESLEREVDLRLHLESTEPVTILADSCDADVGLRIETPEGHTLAEDADSGVETNARLVFRAAAPGEFRLRLVAAQAPGAEARVHVLRGTPASALADERLAAAAYWQLAWSQGIERGAAERCEEALARLLALEPGTTREAIEERLFDAQDCKVAALVPLVEGEQAVAAKDLVRARVKLRELTQALGALASRGTDALLLDELVRGFDLAYEVRDPRVMLTLSERAHAHASRALEECDPHAMLALYRRGLALQNANQPAAARPLLETALSRYSAVLAPDSENVRTARDELAVTLAQMDQISLARPLFEENYEACLRVLAPDDDELMRARLRFATVSAQSGDFETARVLGESLLGWAAGLPAGDLRVVDLKMTLAGALKELGQYARSRQFLEEVAVLAASGADKDDFPLLMTQMNLSALRHLDGDPVGARAALEPAVAALERLLDDREVSLQAARSNLAVMRREQGDLEGALSLEERALAALSELEDHRLSAVLRGERCLTLSAMGDQEALAPALGDLLHTLEIQFGRGAFLSLHEAASVRAELASELGTLLSLVPDAKAELVTGAFELIENARAVALGSAARRGAISADEALRALEERVAGTRRQSALAAEGVRGFGPARPGALSDLVSSTRERDAAERALAEALARSGVPFVSVRTRAVAARLDRESAAVSFVRFSAAVPDQATRGKVARRDEFLAFVLAPDGRLRRVQLGPAAEIEAGIMDWRRALGRPLQDGASEAQGAVLAGPVRSIGGTRPAAGDALALAGEKLRASILDPVLAVLPDGTQALELSLDDVLNVVPLDALPFRGSVLGDALRVRIQPCLGRLLFEEPAPGGETFALLAGDIAYDAGEGEPSTLPALPGTARELGEISAHLRTLPDLRLETLTGAAATKASFLSSAPRARFVHIATHGYAAREREEDAVAGLLPLALCGLTFAGARIEDGVAVPPASLLTAEELAGLDLRRAELVVLSACDTRAGLRRAGQALQSLETALAIAGARSSVTSLWAVDDAAARSLMGEFYRRLFVEHEDRATALWEAKRALRSSGAALADWAGWTLSGSAGTL